jgi:aminopeptidase
MNSEFEYNLEKYAEVIVKVGVNLQPGQRLVIGPPISVEMGVLLETAPLVRMITAKAYQAGARLVDVIWWDLELDLIRLKHAPRDSFREYSIWASGGAVKAAQSGDALLSLISPDHALFAGQDRNLITKTYETRLKHTKPFMDLRGQKAMNYARVFAPIKPWANKIYPDLPPQDRLAQFWDDVFEICRINTPDPLAAWETHIAALKARRDVMNEKRYTGLHFRAPGTDLRVGLPEGHLWHTATMTTQSGIEFTTNIPTEEVFTMPHRDLVDGEVTLSRTVGDPRGDIEGLKLSFSGGKVVEVSAKKGEDHIRERVETIEGANQLGEVALVPHSTPISQTGRIFYHALYDENASCHIALGNAYKLCIEGGENMSDEEFNAAGGNTSRVHSDFMIGSPEMDVDGLTASGSTEPLMRGGEWTFDV